MVLLKIIILFLLTLDFTVAIRHVQLFIAQAYINQTFLNLAKTLKSAIWNRTLKCQY